MMLSRFTMVRGKRPEHDPLPDGIRQDTRKHTRHCLRPTSELVALYLDDPTDENWRSFEKGFGALIDARFGKDRAPFDKLAELARTDDVYLGCSCPTKRNPDVNRCHTVLALRFMKRTYRDLVVATEF